MVTPVGGIPRRNPAPSEAHLLASILEIVPGGIVQVAGDGAILRANDQAQRILGLAWDALGERFVVDFAGETFREDGSPFPVEEYPVAICLATGRPAGPTTLGVKQPSGDVRWAIFTALPFPEPKGDRMGAVVTFVDITDRRRAEVRARAQDRLLDTVRMVHFRDDPGATVAVFHEPLSSFLELTSSTMGFIASVDPSEDPPEELRLHAIIDERDWRSGSSSPPVPIDALSREVLATGRPRIDDSPGAIGGALGKHEPRCVAMLPLVTAGKVVGVVGLADAPTGYDLAELSELEPLLTACADLVAAFDDRRARRNLEAQLAQAERLASVGTLAAGMAHEINNPLAYVLLNLQAFTRQAEQLGSGLATLEARLAERLGEAEARELIRGAAGDVRERFARVGQHGKDAIEGAERVQRIVRDLMTFSRVTEEQRTLVDINGALEVALKMAHHEIKYRARLVRELGQLAPVHGNDGRLSQVFLNLLINAARAIEEGHAEDNEIRVRTWLEDGEVCVEVADTGHGVAPEHMDRLFEPFFSTRAPGAGAGLGLSICHNVVRAHGGRIDVESEVGAGTRFVVRLPAAQIRRDEPAAHQSSAPLPGAARRSRVLLVDDEPMVVRVLAQLLGRTYEVVCADGYASAIAALSSSERVDVILCDMMMLDGTGVDVHAWVTEHDPDLAKRMIFMTGGTFTPRARTFLSEMPVRHLVKPFSLKELDEAVGAILR